jgi:hypothetical protein
MTTENEFTPKLEVVTDYAVQLSVTKPGQIRFLFNPIVGIYESGMVLCRSRGANCKGCVYLEKCPRPEGSDIIEGKMIELTDLPEELRQELQK